MKPVRGCGKPLNEYALNLDRETVDPERRRQGMDVSEEQTRDERELDMRRAELSALETELLERELALSTLQHELAAFQAEYLRSVGVCYAVLDDIVARRTEGRGSRRPDNKAAQKEACCARRWADASAAQTEDPESLEPRVPFRPPAPVKALYRAVARELHPSLASTQEECALRGPWMEKLDAAYKTQDGDALKALGAEWEASREPVQADGVAGNLVRAWLFGELTSDDYARRAGIASELAQVARKIAGAKRRIDSIDSMVAAIKKGDLHKLHHWHAIWLETSWTLRDGTNSAPARTSRRAWLQRCGSLLDRMAAKLDAQIAEMQREGSHARDARAPTSDATGDVFARGLADLERWLDFEFEKEKWARLKPALGRLFLAVRNELKAGQDLLAEFVKKVEGALKAAGVQQQIAKAAVKRWLRETDGGRHVETGKAPGDRPGSGAAGGTAAGGTDADEAMGEGSSGAMPPAGARGQIAEGDTDGVVPPRARRTGADGSESGDDGNGSRAVHETHTVGASHRPVVDPTLAGRVDIAVDCFERARQHDREGRTAEAAAGYRQAAAQGYADAPYQLGLNCLHGAGKRRDHTAGAKWLRRAADQGHAHAQRNLAVLYFKGEGVPRNHGAAVEWLNRAAVQGCALAQWDLAWVYLKGEGVQDPVAAVSWLRPLAEDDERDAQYLLGLLHFNGQGVPRDHAAAAVWFHRAANEGQTEAQYRLGLMHRDGQGVSQDYDDAAGWLRRAAASGHAKAGFVRDRIYRTGKLTPQDPGEQFELADGYFTGYDMPGDRDAAALWFRRAADQGHVDAAYRLGDMYEKGQGVPQDYAAAAARLLRWAADRSHRSAQRDLALLYFYGRGVSRDHDAAAHWLRRAAGAGRVQWSAGNVTFGQRDATTGQLHLW